MKKAILIVSLLLILMPIFSYAALVECGYGTKACTFNDLLGLIPKILNIIWKQITVVLATLFLTIGGIVLLVSAGNPELKNLGKRIIIGTVIGMALIYCSWLLVDFILKALGSKYTL